MKRVIPMDRRSCSPMMVTILFALACLSVWQMIGCPGPPTSVYVTPIYTILPPVNFSEQQISVETLPSWDFSTLINLGDFRFTILNPVCNDSNPLLVVLVHSAPANAAKRQTIRQTWGEPRENVKVLFMLGELESNEKQLNLEEENRIYGDIIQGNFKDAYRNMTYKHVMAFKFAVYYCPQVKYVMKTDDDIFVNMPNLIALLNSDLAPFNTKKLMFCTPFKYPKVKRSYRSKWRVSFREYPSKYYPPYCPGWAVVYSPDTVFMLYREAQRSEYFWIDDVHITGILAKRLDLAHTPLQDFVLTEYQLAKFLRTNGTYRIVDHFLYGPPDLLQDDIFKLWSIVSPREKLRSI